MSTHVQAYAYVLDSMTLGFFRCSHVKMTPKARGSFICMETREAVGASEVRCSETGTDSRGPVFQPSRCGDLASAFSPLLISLLTLSAEATNVKQRETGGRGHKKSRCHLWSQLAWL